MTNLIGLYSPCQGSGKTTLTNVLCEQHGWVSVKFAGTLKAMIRVLLMDGIGLTEEEALRYTDGDRKEAVLPLFGVSTRRMMQTLGTEWRDLIKRTLWIDVVKARVQKLMADGWRIVMDDMRFEHEYNFVRELGGKTVKVIRPGVMDQTGHVSEGALNGHDFDFQLMNADGLTEWKALASHFHETLVGRERTQVVR